jgi:hypothetical protein
VHYSVAVLLVQLQGSAVQIPKNRRPARTTYDVTSEYTVSRGENTELCKHIYVLRYLMIPQYMGVS